MTLSAHTITICVNPDERLTMSHPEKSGATIVTQKASAVFI
jgi:hypothetical protein